MRHVKVMVLPNQLRAQLDSVYSLSMQNCFYSGAMHMQV